MLQRLGVSLFVILASSRLAVANLAPPDDFEPKAVPRPHPTRAEVKAPVRVTKDPVQQTTRIKIPAKLLAKIQAGQGGNQSGRVSQVTPQTDATGRTMIAGLSLAMAAACGFVLLSRKNSKVASASVLTFLFLSLVVAGGAIADIRVPGKPYERPQRELHPPVQTLSRKSEKIVIEITKDGDSVELILGRDARWTK